MTTLAAGSSVTLAVRDGGTVAIATNGGLATAVVSPTEGGSSTVSLGPLAERRTLGPYAEGASVLISNQTCGAFDYDVETRTDPSSVAITGGTIAIPRWPFRRVAINRRSTALNASAPTITYTATTPTGVRTLLPSSQNVQPLGVAAQTYDTGFNYLTFTGNGAAGFEAEFTGDVISYGWRCGGSTLERVMVYVDGQPCMAAPATPSVSTVAGTFYFVTLTFTGVAKRKVEIWVTNTNAMVGVYIPINGAIVPTPRKPVVLAVGDSFLGGSAAVTDNSKLPSEQLWQMFDANVVRSGLGGTGYVSTGSFVTFGDSTRVAIAAALDPDKIIFLGSVNDDGLAGVQAAASACFAAYKGAAPNASVYAFGPQPSNAVDTISTNRSANIAAVKAAAAAQGVTFYDMVGTASGVPAAFSAAASYASPNTVTYRGSVWKCAKTDALVYGGLGAAGPYWDLVTFDLYGTGKVGTIGSDGPRDVLLYSDGVHPTELACGVLAHRLASVLTN